MTGPDVDVTRVVAVSPTQAWAAWADPASWWGPDGFRSEVRELDLRDGGRFDVVMHGPDGAVFENVYVFGEVVEGALVSWVHRGSVEHGLGPSRSVMTIEPVDAASTRVSLRSFYTSDLDRKRHLEDFQAEAGAGQLLARLEHAAAQL
ncbi:SRPBCC domain-containing protein [Catenuloplanes indicus]|uniref:Uncharacterized protein YndB with AHSA1/START domain n=1 Tax=Catenuloplanes indicus TaxID=137267 RepID=A0AAE4B1Y6_9ACTN|nr:SRPBCC domain-containing protein [Catenuloplanes indicus]MDQ0371117.1 uncharacterized protein YndB with AHSA1/START domain [Catenuloplanes indicus]